MRTPELLPLFFVVVVSGCSSAPAAPAAATRPQITIRALEVPFAQPVSVERFSVLVEFEIGNPSREPLTLHRIDLSSVGIGPYNVATTSQDFAIVIPPGQSAEAKVWAQASAGEALGGQEGAVMLRGVAYFESAGGRIREAFARRIMTTQTRSSR